MSIKDFPKKIKSNWENKTIPVISRIKGSFDIKEDVFIILTIILIGLAGFGLGRLSAMEKGREIVTIKPAQFIPIADSISDSSKTPSAINTEKAIQVPLSASAMIAGESAKGMLVAAKTGTKYYFPWCAGVSRISEANKVWFDSYEAAQKAGLTAAANCPNLK